ncbi:MAG: hypothetical protein V4755_15350 [Curtobacterium sp.]
MQHGHILADAHRAEFDRWLGSATSSADGVYRHVSDDEVRLAVLRACQRIALSGSIVAELQGAVEAELAYIDEDGPFGARPTVHIAQARR